MSPVIKAENIVRNETVLVNSHVTPAIRREQDRQEVRNQVQAGLVNRDNRKLGRQVRKLEAQLEQQEEQIQQREEQARKQGFAEGHQQGLEDTRQKLAELTRTLHDLLQEAATGRSRLLQDVGRDLIDLSLSIARRITAQVLEVKPEALVDMITPLLEEYRQEAPFTIDLNPVDMKQLEEMGLLEQLPADRVHLRRTPEVLRHQCRVSMSGGLVVLGESQVDAIGNYLREVLEHE